MPLKLSYTIGDCSLRFNSSVIKWYIYILHNYWWFHYIAHCEYGPRFEQNQSPVWPELPWRPEMVHQHHWAVALCLSQKTGASLPPSHGSVQIQDWNYNATYWLSYCYTIQNVSKCSRKIQMSSGLPFFLILFYVTISEGWRWQGRLWQTGNERQEM